MVVVLCHPNELDAVQERVKRSRTCIVVLVVPLARVDEPVVLDVTASHCLVMHSRNRHSVMTLENAAE